MKIKSTQTYVKLAIAALAILLFAGRSNAQTLIGPANGGDFELGATFPLNNWTVANLATNQWCVGAIGAQAGARGAYVSNSACGNNNYSNTAGFTAEAIHFYRTVAFPVGQATLSFNWRGVGENNFDWLDVYLLPNGSVPVAGTPVNGIAGAQRLLGPLNLRSTWQTATVSLPCVTVPTSYVICFSWRYDFSVIGNPAASVDNILLVNAAAPTTGLTCANAVTIASLPFSAVGQTTVCMNNDYTNATSGACAGAYLAGEDKVYTYTSTGVECLGLTLSNCSTNDIGISIYSGCPGSGGTCIGTLQQATAFVLTGSITLPSAGTYYIIIDTDGTPMTANYDLSIISYGAGPANDLPCNATFLPFGIYFPGNNNCSGSADEPTPSAACGSWGNRNTVWFRVLGTASGCIRVRTVIGSLQNTIIAVYGPLIGTVACGSGNATLTPLYIGCNDNQPNCGAAGFQNLNSQFDITGVLPGRSYYIMVDGVNNATGSFSIMAIDGGASCVNNFPSTPGQDCDLPNPVCNRSISVPDPGYRQIGTRCDFSVPGVCTGGTAGCNNCATTCLCSGEQGSAWFRISINAPGLLEFDIVPNDYTGVVGAESDYDFALYQTISGGVPGPAVCGNLNAAGPIRCHYSALGVTGIYGLTDGVSPPLYPGYGGAYRRGVNVVAGDEFLLVVCNFAANTTGFTLNFSATSPINYTPPPGGTLVWTGAVDTDWFKTGNWGGCAIPTCDYNASIPSFPPNQPAIFAAGAVCRNLDINVGASLTINSTYQLQVCRDFTNNGTFNANNNSTVLFQNTLDNNVNQNINGTLINANRFWHVTASKPAGFYVKANQDIDMAGNFTVTGGGAFGGNFDATSMYHKVGGNIDVQNMAAPIATYTPGTTLEHNGTALSTYRNAGTINSMLMNNSGGGLSLLTNMNISGTGILTLTNGKIITNAFQVLVNNRNFNAVTAGNVNSYVENPQPPTNTTGLRKFLVNTGGTGTYYFPVGTAAKGYQLMQWDVTTSFPNNASLNYVNVGFDGTAPASNATLGPECSAPNYHVGVTALDNGVWRVAPSSSSAWNSGVMNITLYNLPGSYTNPGAGYTVQYNKNGPIATAANWLLNPVPAFCFGNPPITAVLRTNISVATINTPAGSVFYFNTAQNNTPLPVEFLDFSADAMANAIRVKWTTASEKNNKGFELQRLVNSTGEWLPVAWINGHGNSTELNNYKYVDYDVKPDVNYFYRIRQVDFDGKSDYSEVVAAKIMRDKFLFAVQPNPYSGATNITYSLKEKSNVTVEVLNVMGQKVTTLYNGEQQEGYYSYEFSAHKLGFAEGIYTVRIMINNEIYTQRILETK